MFDPFPPGVFDYRLELDAVMNALTKQEPDFFGTWSDQLRFAWSGKTLHDTTERVILVGFDSVCHVPAPFIDRDVTAAFDAGSSISELLETVVVVGLIDGGIHAIHTGLEAVARVVAEREKSGLVTPHRGAQLDDSDRVPEIPFAAERTEPAGPVFPYMHPSPRTYMAAWRQHSPELFAAYREFRAKALALREGLTRKTEELLFVGIDAMIFWPAPLIDHHVHAALNVGATIEELVETVLIAATRRGGMSTIRHGLAAIGRVVDERESAEIAVPRANIVR